MMLLLLADSILMRVKQLVGKIPYLKYQINIFFINHLVFHARSHTPAKKEEVSVGIRTREDKKA